MKVTCTVHETFTLDLDPDDASIEETRALIHEIADEYFMDHVVCGMQFNDLHEIARRMREENL
jgi:hypothetical protein